MPKRMITTHLTVYEQVSILPELVDECERNRTVLANPRTLPLSFAGKVYPFLRRLMEAASPTDKPVAQPDQAEDYLRWHGITGLEQSCGPRIDPAPVPVLQGSMNCKDCGRLINAMHITHTART